MSESHRLPESPIIVMAGGGTGGHVYPAIAVAEQLRDAQPDLDIRFMGTQRGLESRVVPSHGWKLYPISASGLRGKSLVLALRAVWHAVEGTLEASRWLWTWKPRVVMATSGYVSVPVALAAAALGIPVVLHEQNVQVGWSTRVCSSVAADILVAFEGTRGFIRHSRVRVVGNPVRKEALVGNRSEARMKLGLTAQHHVVLVMGGSQGSRVLNEAMASQWKTMAGTVSNLFIVWLTGEAHAASVKERLAGSGFPGVVMGYHDAMGDLYAAADVAVARAGALTLSELAAWGLPAVLVPLEQAGGGHQVENARWFVEQGAAEWVREGAMEELGLKISGMLADPKVHAVRCHKMRVLGRPDAAAVVADRLRGYVSC